MEEIDPRAWNALALPAESPFLEWEWLYLLESTGCVRRGQGWIPLHFTVWRGEELIAAAPLYVRTDSSGEYIFDQIWQEAAKQLNLGYYPKLLGMVPFTPMPGFRLLTSSVYSSQWLHLGMARAVERLCKRGGLSGEHFHFVDPDWVEPMQQIGYSLWEHQGFVWENPGYRDFQDFLSQFTSRQRKTIKKERRAMQEAGVSFSLCSGDDISPLHLDLMYEFYLRTNLQYGPWACLHLNRDFFQGLVSYRSRLLLVCAYQQGVRDPVGMALLVHKGEHLYGRYWGCSKEIKHLHFNTCFYLPMEWAIQKGIRRFDPGIGGAHKHKRGFRPVLHYSLHRFHHPALQQVFQASVPELNYMARFRMEAIEQDMPWRS